METKYSSQSALPAVASAVGGFSNLGIFIGFLAVLTFAVWGSPARAAITNWTNPGTGDWFNCSNWSNGCPDFSKDAVISNGGEAEISNPNADAYALALTLGLNAGESGTLVVDVPPSGSSPNLLTYGISVGSAGRGTLLITNGGFVGIIGPTSIASTSGSTGTVSVSGHASTWTMTATGDSPAQLSIGGTHMAQGGIAVLDAHDGGTIELDDLYTQAWSSLIVWPSGTLTGNGLIVVVGAEGTAPRNVQVNGTLAPSGASGTLTFSFATDSNSSLTLGSLATTACNVTPQDNPSNPQVSVLSGVASLDGRLSVTMTGDFSYAPTRFTLLYAQGGRDPTHLFFSSVSFRYPTDQGWAPQITYDGDYVYLDRVYNVLP